MRNRSTRRLRLGFGRFGALRYDGCLGHAGTRGIQLRPARSARFQTRRSVNVCGAHSGGSVMCEWWRSASCSLRGR
jgi:hypothetical protein